MKPSHNKRRVRARVSVYKLVQAAHVSELRSFPLAPSAACKPICRRRRHASSYSFRHTAAASTSRRSSLVTRALFFSFRLSIRACRGREGQRYRISWAEKLGANELSLTIRKTVSVRRSPEENGLNIWSDCCLPTRECLSFVLARRSAAMCRKCPPLTGRDRRGK